MNIYMVDTNPKVVAQCVPDDVWERRLFDAVELVSEGGAHWEGEESMFICHDVGHAWVSWVNDSKGNWTWSLAYLHYLVIELAVRGKIIDERIVSFADYICELYGESESTVSPPPRCVPQIFKDEKNSINNATLAYRRFIIATIRLHRMGTAEPDWLKSDLEPLSNNDIQSSLV
jgi:hypothetical protein